MYLKLKGLYFLFYFFSDTISFQHVLHSEVGKSQIEYIESENKIEISFYTAISLILNDHSDPYNYIEMYYIPYSLIESTPQRVDSIE